MNTSRPLTLADLVRIGACGSARECFAKLFGESVEGTEELAEKYAHEFDFDFAARGLLGSTARAEYERIHDVARAEYERNLNVAYEEFGRIRAAARAECERTCARTFARLYIQES